MGEVSQVCVKARERERERERARKGVTEREGEVLV